MIDQSVVAAYLATQYWVDARPPFYMTIGTYSLPLHQLHQDYHVSSSAFITAYNPHSVLQTLQVNMAANDALKQRILSAGYTCLSGRGQSAGDWPAEESFLVLGINRSAAVALGKQFQQNAIVFSDESAVPRLIILDNESV